ncbi:MAG: FecR family protein [Sphingobacteriaceae bacterium]|nr:MAG: FecR family protein [Sphingobacteriaceae bacterium]
MGKYSAYKVEDFLLDESFINWVLNNSERDAIFWEAWVSAHPASAPTVKLAQKTLLALYVKPVRTLSDSEIDSMIVNLEERVQTLDNSKLKRFNSISFNQFLSYPIAAMLVMGMLMLAYLYNKSNTEVNKLESVAYSIKNTVNNSGERLLVKLSDGSSVILAPGSKLEYPTYFKGNTRPVSLEGEAFFEVSKDAKHPFLVTSGNLVTRVVGTSFTIKAYNGTKEYKVIVNTGKVLVSQKINNTNQDINLPVKHIAVVPNQQIIYNTSQKSMIKENLPQPLMLSADVSKDVFTFNDTPLNKVISSIERAYNVSIIYNEKEIGGCPLTASLAEEHLLEKLDLISKALDVKYYINDGHIMLAGAGCSKQIANKN